MREISRDLTLLRKHLKLEVQDIHEATRFPIDRIEAFESGTLFEDSDFESNITYIRSFVRAYGKALKLPDDILIDCLDFVELGSYNRQLIDFFESSQKKKGKKETVKKQIVIDDTAEPVESSSPETSPQDLSSSSQSSPAPKPTSTTGSQEAQTSPTPLTAPHFKKPPVDGVDWASKPIKGRTRAPIPPHVWIIGVVSTLVLMAMITLVWWFSQREPGAEDSSSNAAAGQANQTELADGTASNTGNTGNAPNGRSGNASSSPSFAENAQNESGPSNSDAQVGPNGNPASQNSSDPLAYLGSAPLNASYSVLVYAANGRLEPIRIWSDQKPEIDPYWIEQGHAMRFEMNQELRLSGQFSNLRLIVNGRDIGPISPNSAQNGIPTFTLTPSSSQMANVPREPQPINLQDDILMPTQIVDRPTFE